jgi:hypothetical protein
MRRRSLLSFGVSFVFAATAASVLAQDPGKAQADHKAAISRLVLTPAGAIKWADLDPQGAPGVKIADLWGDHATGAFGALVKLPAGFAVPLHTHSSDMRVVFLSGTYIQAPDGKPEVRLGPGSYMMQPGAGYRHTTGCDKAADCVFFLESDGPFDLHVVGGTPPGAAASVAADSTMGAWMGSWKLNEAKTNLGAGATKNHTVSYATSGDNLVVTVDGVSADGKAVHHVWTGKLDGKDYPVTGDPTGNTRAYKKIDASTLEFVGKKDGKVTVTGRVTHSADGKTRTVTTSMTDATGKKIKSTAIYDKM